MQPQQSIDFTPEQLGKLLAHARQDLFAGGFSLLVYLSSAKRGALGADEVALLKSITEFFLSGAEAIVQVVGEDNAAKLAAVAGNGDAN